MLLYILFALPGMLLSVLASIYTKSMFSRYSEVEATSGITGAQAAQRLLHQAGIYDVAIEETEGFLSDHYDPSSKTLRLSPAVFEHHSLSAIGVACHEAGHAIQHAQAYTSLGLRSAMVPMVQITSYMSYILFLPGLFMSKFMIMAGLVVGAVRAGDVAGGMGCQRPGEETDGVGRDRLEIRKRRRRGGAERRVHDLSGFRRRGNLHVPVFPVAIGSPRRQQPRRIRGKTNE